MIINDVLKSEFQKKGVDIDKVISIHNTAFFCQKFNTGFNDAYRSVERLYEVAYQKGLQDAQKHGVN